MMPRKRKKEFQFEFQFGAKQFGRASPDIHTDTCEINDEIRKRVEAHDTYIVTVFHSSQKQYVYRGGADLDALQRFCDRWNNKIKQ